ncbi:MAG: flavin reductase family protein [Candidatus Heimdallarchaeota archaeon]|nr:flavin reductase family protein [Candidatus Heimdallarchaeota archaeon]
MKISIKNLQNSYRFMYPRPTVIVTSGTIKKPSGLTIAWSMPLSVDPPLVGVSITRKRYSYSVIEQYKEYVINIPNSSQVKEAHYIGTVSTRDTPQKIKDIGFTLEKSKMVEAPRIKECQINLECKLIEIKATGDHDLFIGEVIDIAIDPTITDNWAFNLAKFQPIYWRQSKSSKETFKLDLSRED